MRKRGYVVFILVTLFGALMIMPGMASARSENSSETGRYLAASLYQPEYSRFIVVDIGDFRYFDPFWGPIQTRYVTITAYFDPTPEGEWIPPITVAQKYYGPDEEFGLNFNFGVSPSFVGEINGYSLSVVLNLEGRTNAYKYPSELYKFNQMDRQGSASVMFSGWGTLTGVPVDGWTGGVTKTVAVPLG